MAKTRMKTKEKAIDALDRAILAALLEDARLSQVDLSERIPLSPTAIARRIRALEEAGVIEGYRADVNHRALDLGMTVPAPISPQSHTAPALAASPHPAANPPSALPRH